MKKLIMVHPGAFGIHADFIYPALLYHVYSVHRYRMRILHIHTTLIESDLSGKKVTGNTGVSPMYRQYSTGGINIVLTT
jgi:hypothetical protein